MGVNQVVVTHFYLTRYNRVCASHTCDHEFELGEIVYATQSSLFCLGCLYTEPVIRKPPPPQGAQSYRVYVTSKRGGVVPHMAVRGVVGEPPTVLFSWVRNNKRTLARYTGFEIIREEEMVA